MHRLRAVAFVENSRFGVLVRVVLILKEIDFDTTLCFYYSRTGKVCIYV